ncbi:assimilatory sulfite reductase (NADPH) flavoprotein subunit [Methylogaea oryzae]|uniref:Sulfite reductase [NADPH] flavoprotein alpha-component n=1 Tax=Methylogaea oryzae TaxID=1295382 RepID=A0A8D4VNU6_9GAMM|nr:assimilatory sulfite reductase (NADPH) flavoprotein subunit [Methylogaea oryzae]BBL70942.1 sulfite reductase [NADPH] flavoprotein alpha-component [Methylogaea oryzae]
MNRSPGPLSPAQQEALARLLEGISPDQVLWLAGYFAGLDQGRLQAAPAPRPAEAAPAVTVLFGSQTGNAERLARSLRSRLTEAGFDARAVSMDSYKTAELKRERCLIVVVSTYGEGEPPDGAKAFHEWLLGKRAPQLAGLRYAVLALGDSSYEYFCKTGRDFDERLASLGAAPLLARVDCDLDYEETATAWADGLLASLGRSDTAGARSPVVAAPAEASPAYSKQRPFPARLLENIRLTGRGSSKEVRHIELSLADSGLSYEPGDALGVVPRNWPERVDQLIAALGFSAEAAVPGADGVDVALRQALLGDYEITTLTRPFLQKYAELCGSADLTELLKPENRTALRDFVYGREILDVVRDYPTPGMAPERFVGLLRKLPPRLYSIASSQRADPDEVHLTVGVVRYRSHGLARQGVASAFLADRVAEGETVPVYVHSNPHFRLPSDPNAPIVMVGPGTGVAPFRAFMAEREALGAAGRNWLFFGDRNFDSDFLYQREWLEYRRSGLLTRLDVAFSRDDESRVYVQQRMLEHSRLLYAWLEEGAYFYVCGDAERMAPDVHEALLAVVRKEGGQGNGSAEDYVQQLHAAKRYQRDVY